MWRIAKWGLRGLLLLLGSILSAILIGAGWKPEEFWPRVFGNYWPQGLSEYLTHDAIRTGMVVGGGQLGSSSGSSSRCMFYFGRDSLTLRMH